MIYNAAMNETRDRQFSIRVSPAELNAVVAAARNTSRKVADYVRWATLRQADLDNREAVMELIAKRRAEDEAELQLTRRTQP